MMARRGPGRPRRSASVARLVDKTEKEEEEKKAKKLASTKEQQQTSNHQATNVITPRAGGKPVHITIIIILII
jgi:hypothetical protein